MKEILTTLEKKMPFPIFFICFALLAPIIIPVVIAEEIFKTIASEKEHRNEVIKELKKNGVSHEEALRLTRDYSTGLGGYYLANSKLREIEKNKIK